MNNYILYGTESCHYCALAEQWIKAKGDTVTKYIVGKDVTKDEFKKLFPGATTVPQIIHDGKHIGGYTELTESVGAQVLKG
tara:strand:- start:794 stop:1036 length:243 start_codon:yes stop_codon:yes gene_type:complete